MRWFPSIDPSLMATSLTAELEIENIFVAMEFKTDRSPGRGPSFSS
jgi:hypothetical protein